jgi:biotin transporter BioY
MWWCDERRLALHTTFMLALRRHCLHGVEFCGGSGGYVLGFLELRRRLVLGGGGVSSRRGSARVALQEIWMVLGCRGALAVVLGIVWISLFLNLYEKQLM